MINMSTYQSQSSRRTWPEIIRDMKPQGVELSDDECLSLLARAKASAESIDGSANKAAAIAKHLQRSKRLLKGERARQ